MNASLFVQGLINGLNQGAIYALIALGYTMVYGIIRMINFAHGDFIMIGAYTLFYTIPLMVDAGMPAWMAVIVAVAVCALVGVLVEILAYRPVRKAGPMSALITALAMSIFLENLAMVLFGAKPHNVQAIFSLPTITVGGVSLPLNVLLTIGIGVAMMLCMQLFVKKTKLGKAMRAVSEDMDAARLMGINVNSTISFTFAVGSALAGIGYTPVYDKPFFHEFVTKTPIPAADVEKKLADKGILSGLPIGENEMLWCATEMNTKAQMDAVIAVLKGEE